MSYRNRIATEIINIVGSRQTPSQVRPWFGLYDRPIADAIKYPDSFRVESTGWDCSKNEFVYVLYDRFMTSDSLIVIKQSKTTPPLAQFGAQLRMMKRNGHHGGYGDADGNGDGSIDLGTEIVTVRGCRAVCVAETPTKQYEYVYEIHFEDGNSSVLSEAKMKLMIDVHNAIARQEANERLAVEYQTKEQAKKKTGEQ